MEVAPAKPASVRDAEHAGCMLQVREVGDGNINFVYIVEGPRGGLVLKQGLPYIRIAPDWPLTQARTALAAVRVCVPQCRGAACVVLPLEPLEGLARSSTLLPDGPPTQARSLLTVHATASCVLPPRASLYLPGPQDAQCILHSAPDCVPRLAQRVV